ncbi:MAG TPA: hypothetical protein PKM43_14290 [Verrucomicrobiota bacterium]|nr:hypothetical protein [Verrucomicrobiota bacterium]HRZ36298.1 hypothetical protein [Candidatus Paceibacterota bacterium]HRZ55177.1 hypothetical protein [Candidatus Paceibacterota bacterium]
MIAKKPLILIAVGACVLGLVGFASQKKQVERPLKATVQVTVVITLDSGGIPLSAVADGAGKCDPLGQMTSLGIGIMAESGYFFLTGTMTTANGDQLFWESAGPDLTVFTGGTGRFEGASGGYTVEYTKFEYRDGPFPGIVILDAEGLAEGTIAY